MSKRTKISNELSNLSHDCLINVFSKLSVEEILEGPMLLCKPWNASGSNVIHEVFDFGSRTVQLTASEEFDWNAMEENMDRFLKAFADRSNDAMKIIKIKIYTDISIFYVSDTCSNLEVIWLTSCPSVIDASLLKIATKCKKLKELCIRTPGQITNKALEAVKENLPKVNILEN